jgi:hypothetical protein
MVKHEVRLELEAIDRTFARVSKNKRAAIRFLAKAGIVTKQGRLAKEYR